MHRRYAPVLVFCALVAVMPALALDAPDFSSAREKSMGGRHVALADDYSVLLANPAGLTEVPRVFSAADLGIQAIGPVFDMANFATGGVFTKASITDFLAKNNYKLYAGLDLTGPLAFGYTGGGLGFGLFNKTRAIVNVASANSIGVKAEEDLMLSGGYAFRFELGKGHALSAGVAAKGYVFGAVDSKRGIVEAMSIVSDPMSLLNDGFVLTTGIGIDAGLRWSWKEIAAGLVCRDLYSPAIVTQYDSPTAFLNAESKGSKSDSLDRGLDFGFEWSPALGRLGEYVNSFVVALDYRDILDLASALPRNAILNVGLGLEARVLDIITLRGGINEALPSAGLALDLSAFNLSLAAYGTELGLDPGDRPCYNLLVDFDFKY